MSEKALLKGVHIEFFVGEREGKLIIFARVKDSSESPKNNRKDETSEKTNPDTKVNSPAQGTQTGNGGTNER